MPSLRQETMEAEGLAGHGGAERAGLVRRPLSNGPEPLRVLIFDHTARLGGGEIALYDLVRFLDRSRVTPIVLLASDGPLADKLRGLVELVVLPMAPDVLETRKDSLGAASLMKLGNVASSLRYIFGLARLTREKQIDLVHTNSLKADILGGLAGRLAGKPVIWHIRDRIEKDYLPAQAVTLMRALARMIPVYVIANSAATLSTVRLQGKVPGVAISSGVDLSAFEASQDEGVCSAERGGSNGRVTIGIVGRLCSWKGQHVFLQAAAMLHRQWPQARFQIIGAALFGEECYVDELKALTAQLGLAEVVEFTGFRSDVNALIRKLTVLVHASTTGEPFGQVIVQGMAAGKPVVATHGGGVPEIVVDGVTGYLVPMGDAESMAEAVGTLLASPEAAREMGRKGRERIEEKFTIQSSARAVEAVYEAVVARGKK